jgi:hypothetical protein
MPGTDVAAQAGAGSKLKVFISYSRKDQSIAGELVSGLELCGFDSYLDKEDIAPGEPWEERLGRLIRDADTVVFVLSPNSVASKHCTWEVDETIKLAKRIVPVVWRPVPDADVPAALRRLNYIFFSEGNSFSKSLGDLARALRVDLDWIREHTRLGELAANWDERRKPEGLLLRGSEIADAKAWLAKRPKDAPEITMAQQAFIDASIQAAEDDLKRRLALQWRAKAGTIAAAIIFAIGAAVSTFAWFEANSARVALQASVEDLRGKNLRLNRKIALRVAAYGNLPYFVGPNWYQIATDYSGAIAIVGTGSGSGVIGRGTGFIVRGSALYAPWGEEPVFVTASHVVADKGGPAIPHDEAHAYFPGLEDNKEFIGFSELLWSGPKREAGISVLRIKGPLPFGAKPIDKVRHSEWESLPYIDTKAPDGGPGPDDLKPVRALASVGFAAGEVGFAIFLNNLLGVITKDDNGMPLQLGYTYVTQPGASGSPVFDVETGELVAVHELGSRPEQKVRTGGGISIVAAIAAIEADLGKPSSGP